MDPIKHYSFIMSLNEINAVYYNAMFFFVFNYYEKFCCDAYKSTILTLYLIYSRVSRVADNMLFELFKNNNYHSSHYVRQKCLVL